MNVTVNQYGLLSIRPDSSSPVVELTLAEAVDLLERLTGLLPTMAAPDLKQGQGGCLVCPHCNEVHVPGTETGPVVEVDSSVRHNDTRLWTERDSGPNLSIDQGDSDFATMVFLTTCCGKPVSVPAEVSVNWS